MKKILIPFIVLFFTGLLSVPNVVADNSPESQQRRANRDQAAGGYGVTGIGGLPRQPGITPPFTMIGGGRYRDGNGKIVIMTGPDGNERFEYENMDDYWEYQESQDTEWPKHKGKFPGTYQEWKDLQQYKDPSADLWGDGKTDYDWMRAGPDTSSIGQDLGEAGTNMEQMMEGG